MSAGNKKKKNVKAPKKVNPFELKYVKSKYDILGKKKLAHVGAPTASRKRAHEQREKTLGVEFDRAAKVSKIVDKRIGENENKTEEEKGVLRFKEERVKSYKKASKFNLSEGNDTEELVLTHHGQALSDIEKYDKSMLSDDDDDDDPGNLGANIVKVAHFGGGEKSNEEVIRDRLSRKDFISEMIARTKMDRHDKQAAKDDMENLTQDLDEKYTKLFSKMVTSFRPVGASKDEKQKKDEYDNLALSLKIEADQRAVPTDRLKTDVELAVIQKNELETLERNRLARMNALKNSASHLSADADVDVYAGAKADAKKAQKKGDRFEVRFNDDKLIDGDSVGKSQVTRIAIDSDDEDALSDVDDEEDDDELLDDMLEDEEEPEDVETVEEGNEGGGGEIPDQTISIPFVIEMPRSYKQFTALLSKYEGNFGVVLDRLIKLYHPSLKEGNKQRLNKLFMMTLRMYDDLAKTISDENNVTDVNGLLRSLHILLKFDVAYGVRCVRALIREYWKKRDDGNIHFGHIALTRLVSELFPTTDSWHPVCTPALFLAARILGRTRVGSLHQLTKLLLLAFSLLKYVNSSKRIIPELLAFAKSVILLAVREKPESFPSPGFPISKPYSELLCIVESDTCEAATSISLRQVFSSESVEDGSLKQSVLRSTVSLIQLLKITCSTHESGFTIIFRPFIRILKEIDTTHLLKSVKDDLETLIASIEAECEAKNRLTQIALVKTEKSMLKMLEPRFEFDFDPERPRKGKDTSRIGVKGEKKRLEQDLKKETRSAIKELRKDTAFLARKQMDTIKTKDRDRNIKTKRLMSGLMNQQGEWNKELREAGKKKK